jgi:hypothetical protein
MYIDLAKTYLGYQVIQNVFSDNKLKRIEN